MRPLPVVQCAPPTEEEKKKFYEFYNAFYLDPEKAHERYAPPEKPSTKKGSGKQPLSAPKLSDRVKLMGHIYEGKDAQTGALSKTPTGLHAYSDPPRKGKKPVTPEDLGVLPQGAELVGTLGDLKAVHIIVWKKGGKETYSTMMPRTLRQSQTRALFMAGKYPDLHTQYYGNGIPSLSAMTTALLGEAELKKVGDTIYPSFPKYEEFFFKTEIRGKKEQRVKRTDAEILEAIKKHPKEEKE